MAVIGLGGVGAYAAEMIARAGVGKMLILDSDVVSDTNRNRQHIPAQGLDFLVDAIDTLAPKIALISHCVANAIPLGCQI